ncbi:MAG: hypothetical protein D3919_06060 [Candidatus Electrothrix sp. AW5]|jgi:hypothetical protein|nr:hypothetical protein [Candidatus Electrothrix gigas]
MVQRSNIVAVAGSIVALIIGTLFVWIYTEIHVARCEGLGGALPTPCLLLHSLSLPALLMPVGFAGTFAFLVKRQRLDQLATVLLVVSSWLLTLSWILTCLFVWELPYFVIGQTF